MMRRTTTRRRRRRAVTPPTRIAMTPMRRTMPKSS